MDPVRYDLDGSADRRVGEETNVNVPKSSEQRDSNINVLSERGSVNEALIHDEARVEASRSERERDALAVQYARYAATADRPVPFDRYAKIVRRMRD